MDLLKLQSMAQNREEILADFQACTGIEDVAEAIFHLDETDWDLLQAVNRVVPPDSQAFNNSAIAKNDMMDDDETESNIPGVVTLKSFEAFTQMSGASMPLLENHIQPSTSDSKTKGVRILHFNIQYCDRTISVDIPDTGTLADLKLKINNILKIPPCRQLLSNWARLSQYEDTPLSQLMLPKENSLQLQIKSSDNSFSADKELEVTERLTGTYVLRILDENANKQYSLKYLGSKTILEVKSDVYSLTDVPVRNQLWSGWPPNIDDQTMLALSGISYPEHELKLRRNCGAFNNVPQCDATNNVSDLPDSDDDEFEDATESFTVDDEMFVDNVSAKRIEPLIPDRVEDEVIGTISFVEQFTARYGPIHPAFYQGTLEEALKEACTKSAKNRKILAVYLHHDASVLANVFCTQLLCVEGIVQLFETSFIVWGWDLTFESNRSKLQSSVNNCLGPTAATSLKNIPVDRLPAIVIIMRIRSSTDVFSVVHGNVGVSELLTSLVEASEVFSEHQRVEMKEEEERTAREMVKLEQDLAYRESLEADRAKEEAKRMQEQAIVEERKRVESKKSQEAAKREAFRKGVEASLPPEPSEHGDHVTKIRFRLPKGENLERRFLANMPLKVLLDYLIVKGYPSEDYKVISSWPRRDLTSFDYSKTLQELKLCPQETVILEER